MQSGQRLEELAKRQNLHLYEDDALYRIMTLTAGYANNALRTRPFTSDAAKNFIRAI